MPYDHLVVTTSDIENAVRILEPQRINIGDTENIIGSVIVNEAAGAEVIIVNDLGPQGGQGLQGNNGLSGAGKPFTEIISGQLFRATSSISIFSTLSVTGSAYITQNLITMGRLGVNISSPSSFAEIVSDDGAIKLLNIKSQSLDVVYVNRQGLFVLGEYSYTPTPVAGSIFFSASNFYFGT